MDRFAEPRKQNRFAELRKQARLSQEEASAMLGVDRSTVAKWETGAAFPRGDKLPAVARAYGCEIKDLYEVTPVARETDGNGVK